MVKKFLSTFLALALCLTLLPTAVLAEETGKTIYTKKDYPDRSDGTINHPHANFEYALKNANDGDTIVILGTGYLNDSSDSSGLGTGQPCVIDKNITIKGADESGNVLSGKNYAELQVRRNGIILGKNVKMKNIQFLWSNGTTSAIFANGHQFTLENVTQNTTSGSAVHLFAGGLSSDSTTAGSSASISLTNCTLGSIYAGGMGKSFSGDVSITLNSSTVAGIYGGGAAENSISQVDTDCGASGTLTLTGLDSSDELDLRGTDSITINGGTAKPTAMNADAALTLTNSAVLNLTGLTDKTVNSLSGGGKLQIGKTDTVTINTVTGTYEVETVSGGVVCGAENNHTYIKQSNGNGTFSMTNQTCIGTGTMRFGKLSSSSDSETYWGTYVEQSGTGNTLTSLTVDQNSKTITKTVDEINRSGAEVDLHFEGQTYLTDSPITFTLNNERKIATDDNNSCVSFGNMKLTVKEYGNGDAYIEIVKNDNDIIAGTYEFTISAPGASDTVSDKFTLTVTDENTGGGLPGAAQTKLEDSNVTVTGGTYTGQAITPTVTVTVGGKNLTEGTDYTLSGDTSATDAGTYSVAITGRGDYTDTVTKEWTIAPMVIEVASVLASGRAYEKDNTSVEISDVTFSKVGDKVMETPLTKGTDYTATGTISSANAGTYNNATVKVTLKNANYTFADNNTNTEATTTVTIEKATLPQPTFGIISESGKWLSNVDWNVDARVELTWDDGDSEIEQGKSYAWTLTPDNKSNYNVLTGTYIPWPASSEPSIPSEPNIPSKPSEPSIPSKPNTPSTPSKPENDKNDRDDRDDRDSGSSNTTTSTNKNPNGSTTTTETNNKTGEMKETTKTKTGTSATVTTNKSGDVTSVAVSVSTADAKSGRPVTLPIDEVKNTSDSGGAQEIDVTLPSGASSARVEIPVEHPTPGTVVVIVDENGKETIVPTSQVTENGVTVTLTGNTTVKVIDNAGVFHDVPAASTFYSEIAAMSARNIMVGKGGENFDLYSEVTLNQIANVAGRVSGKVNVDDYTGGVAWGAANGLPTGDQPATRGDVLTALWIAAGAPSTANSGQLSQFTDSGSVPPELLNVVLWAVENGIMKGNDDSTLGLDSNVTRGQTAALAGRALDFMA